MGPGAALAGQGVSPRSRWLCLRVTWDAVCGESWRCRVFWSAHSPQSTDCGGAVDDRPEGTNQQQYVDGTWHCDYGADTHGQGKDRSVIDAVGDYRCCTCPRRIHE